MIVLECAYFYAKETKRKEEKERKQTDTLAIRWTYVKADRQPMEGGRKRIIDGELL